MAWLKIMFALYMHAKVTMPSTSKSNRQKPKEQRQVMQPTRNWLELPSDVIANILSRVGVRDILENAQNVCTVWQKICKDPSMWRVICIYYPDLRVIDKDFAMCKQAVDRSQGQLIDITIGDFGIFGDDELLQYVANRSSQLRCLKIITIDTFMCRSWIEALKKFPLLEELSLYSNHISKEIVETVGCYCPSLKTLKLNEGDIAFYMQGVVSCDKTAITIGENLHELEHLELIGNRMSNTGLQVILDGCHHLKSLDLRMCPFIDITGDLGKRCSQQIKCLKLPNDSLEAVVTMPSTSKSKRQKTKEQWQVGMQPTRNWLELPSDVMASILSRVGVVDILENAQKVCTTWREICKDPSMWRVICIDYLCQYSSCERLAMCKHAVDRSQGQLIDITIGHFGWFSDVEMLQYVADRSSKLRRLKVKTYNSFWCRSLAESLKQFPLLEEFSFHSHHIPKEVETVACFCPLLKTLKLNKGKNTFGGTVASCDKMAITIGENLHELENLELIGNQMSNNGLQVILDGCRHLKSLDLRMCRFIDLKGQMGKRCSQQIKCLKLPNDSLEGCQCVLPISKNNLLFGLVSETEILTSLVHGRQGLVGCPYGSWSVSGRVLIMPSTSKSKRQKTKKQWQVMQPTRNWLELPSDVMASILSRVGLHDIIENAEKVCTAWRQICKDPSMWRVICIDYPCQYLSYERFINLGMHAVDRSQGQLIDITIHHFEIFGDFELLRYVADRSSRLRRLKIITYHSSWEKAGPTLEEISIIRGIESSLALYPQ
ncbi:hypothetical protein OSB04_005415 [Centaurea solstitialis]|uniref:F-box domain-containing protein n=1 Tax=Centaurea solstitialis TaxID=347529 RepID=A0AA38WPM8_9ASTR|nr:hypothetical protein OSB04_005415 [Centaurea solstitialis]